MQGWRNTHFRLTPTNDRKFSSVLHTEDITTIVLDNNVLLGCTRVNGEVLQQVGFYILGSARHIDGPYIIVCNVGSAVIYLQGKAGGLCGVGSRGDDNLCLACGLGIAVGDETLLDISERVILVGSVGVDIKLLSLYNKARHIRAYQYLYGVLEHFDSLHTII